MASSDGDGFVWILAIAVGVWGWNMHGKLKDETRERIESLRKAESRNLDLETRIIALERKLDETKQDIGIAKATVDAVSDQVSNNAKVANENAVADMTARGACGKETVWFDNGGWSIRNKECTIKDLRK